MTWQSPPVAGALRKVPDIILRRIGNEALLVPVRRSVGELNSLFTLNSTAIVIWEALDGHIALSGLVDRLCEEFDVDRVTAEADIRDVLNALKESGLIEPA